LPLPARKIRPPINWLGGVITFLVISLAGFLMAAKAVGAAAKTMEHPGKNLPNWLLLTVAIGLGLSLGGLLTYLLASYLLSRAERSVGRQHLRLRRAHRCINCGYDLSSISGDRCPECGYWDPTQPPTTSTSSNRPEEPRPK
jgi:hypothetical protein